MKNILITGGLGHIGSYLIRNLSFEYNIKVIDNLLTQRYCSLFNLNRKISFKEKDIRSINIDDLENIDIVIHLAAITDAGNSFKNQKEIEEINIIDTKIFIDTCKKSNVKLFIFPSTTSVYGVLTKMAYEDNSKYLKPQSVYAESKLDIENYIEKELGDNVKYLILRLGTIFGISEGMRFHTAINKFCYQSSLNIPLTIWKENYNQIRSYLGLNDLNKCLEYLFSLEKYWNQVYNVVSYNKKLVDIIDIIKNNIKNVELNMVDTPLLNQYSYEVSTKKIKNTGFLFEDDIEYHIKLTLDKLSKLN